MVKIPSPGELGLGQQVQNNNVPTVYQNFSVNADMFGAQQGREMQKLGNNIGAIAGVATKIKDEQDKADSYNAMNKAEEDIRTSHYDPEKGIYNRKGAQALTAYEDSRKAVDEIYAKNADGLNPQAQFKFQQMWGQKRESVLNGSARFEAQQRNAYKNEATDALVNNSIDDAITNYNNPQAVQDNAALVQYAIEDSVGELPKDAAPETVARRNEILKQKTTEAFDKLHTGVISKFAANGRPDVARSYYKNVKEDISGLNQIKIDAMLRESTLRGDSQSQFDKIAKSGKSEAEQLQMARDIKNPELRDAVEARVKSSWNEPKSLEQQKANIVKTEVWNQILNNKKPEQIPLELWTGLDAKTKQEMTRYSTDGGPQDSNKITYLTLNDQMLRNEKQFKELNLLDYVMELDDKDFKYFSDHQKQLLNEDRTGKNSIRTYQQIANDRLEAVGITTTTKGSSEDKRRVADFYRTMTDNLDDFAATNGRKPKDIEVEQIIDKMLIKGEVKERELGTGRFGTDSKFAFEGNYQSFTIEDVNSIPANYRRMAKSVLEKKGYIANDENIVRTVNEFLKKNRQ